MAAVAKGAGGGDLVAPAHGAGGQGVQQELPQRAAQHLGPRAVAVVGLLEHEGFVLVEHAQCLTALVDETEERVEETGVLEGELPVVVVDVEHAALGAGAGRGLRLVDGDRNAVDVQDPGERQPAEPGADDRDGCGHGATSLVRAVPAGAEARTTAHGKSLERRSSTPPQWNGVPGPVKLEHGSSGPRGV